MSSLCVDTPFFFLDMWTTLRPPSHALFNLRSGTTETDGWPFVDVCSSPQERFVA